MQNQSIDNEDWVMNIFTFPYWFIVDKYDLNKVVNITIDNAVLRFYPPYRSSPANNQFLPQPDKALFLDGKMKLTNPAYSFPKVAIYPLFNDNGIGICAFQAEEREEWDSNRRNRKDMPVDTIRVDVKAGTNFILLKQLRILFEIIRTKSNQWWIGQLPYSNDYIQVTQSVDANGESTQDPPEIFSPYVFVSDFNERVIDFDIWLSSLDQLSAKQNSVIYKSALMDAMYFCAKNDTRRTVLDIARALDTALDVNFRRIWVKNRMGTSGNYSRKVFIRGIPPKIGESYNSSTLIPLLISHITQHLLGKSFENDDIANFTIIDEFWEHKRNPVSHGAVSELEPVELSKYIKSAEKCIAWLEIL